MPHVIVKLWPGRNDEVKKNLSEKIAETVAENLNVDIGDVSVAVEEVTEEEWDEKVYKAEIKNNPNIYYKPGYEYE